MDEIHLAKFAVGDRIAGARLAAAGIERRIEREHPVVVRVRGVKIACRVERHGGRKAEGARVDHDTEAGHQIAVGTIAERGRETTALAEHRVRHRVAGAGFIAGGVKRRVVLQQAVVARIGNVEIAGTLGDQPLRLEKTVGT